MSHDSHKKYAHAFDEVLRSVGDKRASQEEPAHVHTVYGAGGGGGTRIIMTEPKNWKPQSQQEFDALLRKSIQKAHSPWSVPASGGVVNPNPVGYDATKDWYTFPNGKRVSALAYAEMNHVPKEDK